MPCPIFSGRHFMLLVIVTALAGQALAQEATPIERVKHSDGELGCQQMADEVKTMDQEIAQAKVVQSSGQTTQTAGQAAGIAAEVASRIGMFGTLGGLGGHLFGTAASKTAAGMTEQTGVQSAAQAAERERQAVGRKEYISSVFIAKGCSASNPSAPPSNPNAVVAAAATATTAPTTPTTEVTAQTLAGERLTPLALKLDVINPEDLLSSNKTLVIPTLYLSLITQGRVSAVKQSGMFQSGNATARSSANYRVAGIDKAYAQKLAQAILDNLITQLRQAGYTVLTYADVKDRDVFKAAARDPSASAFNEGGNDYLVVTPSDEQMFKIGFGGIAFSEFWSRGKTRIADATLLIPQFTFHAPQAWAEGSRGYKSVSATTNVVHGMNMWTARVTWLGQPVSRMGRGMPGVATREQVINVSERVGTLSAGTDASPDAANALSGVLSALSGAGNIQRNVTNYVLTIDRDAFAAGVINGAYNFNTEVARAAAAAKP